ncbi:hypothetical protein [Mycolicibacterium fortuitum]|uniref:hypothetical protein n=1 Tax=Mycolicibacterium fortuitum TaxID=1766 RepID=UPI00262C86C8|nr:hypothetical protein [Mycolicibacterium fortuitum]
MEVRLKEVIAGAQVPAGEAADVQFSLSKGQGTAWILRNTGTETAEHVRVEPITGITRGFPTDAAVRPGEGIDLLMRGTWQSHIPHQLYVSWAGQQTPVALPVVQ